MSPLRILIQDRPSKNFLKNRRSWTAEMSDARSFPTAFSAFFFAAEAKLHDVEIVWMRPGTSAVQKVI